jgi:hypothetical protein
MLDLLCLLSQRELFHPKLDYQRNHPFVDNGMQTNRLYLFFRLTKTEDQEIHQVLESQ